jgi:hypothetical protein
MYLIVLLKSKYFRRFVLAPVAFCIAAKKTFKYFAIYQIIVREEGSRTMPIATVSPDDEPVTEQLKTCPPDGFVMLQRLSHGQKMHRRQLSSKMSMKAGKGKKDVETVIEAFNTATELYDFATCIVDHNLTDKSGRKLNFKIAADVQMLKGPIGEEISTLMDNLNNFEADEEVGNLSEPSETLS